VYLLHDSRRWWYTDCAHIFTEVKRCTLIIIFSRDFTSEEDSIVRLLRPLSIFSSFLFCYPRHKRGKKQEGSLLKDAFQDKKKWGRERSVPVVVSMTLIITQGMHINDLPAGDQERKNQGMLRHDILSVVFLTRFDSRKESLHSSRRNHSCP
jgi:hypothetical protein